MHPLRMSACLLLLAAAPLPAQQPLPLDPAVTVGRLANGVRYYIRENRLPARRAELRLVINAGSVLEDPDQLGLAHVVEHMAFNGTAHFPKHALVDFMEGIGMSFGADLNASTGFDETEYQLTVPTDSAGMLERAVQVLEDWAQAVTFDTAQIRLERGVVLEEWRLGRGAEGRLRDHTLPVVFRGSRYAERLPIGAPESLRGFSPAALTRFYRDWYRPDLMAVVAVGDFDRREVERMIRDRLGSIPRHPRPRVRPVVPVPPRTDQAVVVATDPEATRTLVGVQIFRPAVRDSTVAGYRASLVDGLYGQMLHARLDELAERPDPPFIGAGASTGRPVRALQSLSVMAAVRDSLSLRGFTALLTEMERVERHGFLPAELERAKLVVLEVAENAYTERDHTESAGLAAACVAHFLTGQPMPGIVAERALVRRLLDSIPLSEVNRAAQRWGDIRDRVISLTGPEAARSLLPTRAELLATAGAVAAAPIAPYSETIAQGPLVPDTLPEAAIVSETADTVYGVTRWTLSNGARLILKPTDFKADEVVLSAYSPGGLSRLDDSLLTAAAFAPAALRTGGVGAFSAVDLQKKLAGRLVSVGPFIGGFDEGLIGGGTPRDLRTMLELVYLLFTAPRIDSAAFSLMHANARTQLLRRTASPAAAFQDTLAVTLGQHHPWSRPMTPARTDSVDIGKVYGAYRDRFADASDFVFVLVGSFDLDSLRPLARRFLGNLPSLRRDDTPRDPGLTTPAGVVEREVRQGIAPQSQTAIVFSGALEWTPVERLALAGVAQVLETRLRASLREALGGTYGVSVSAEMSRVPRPEYRLRIAYGSDPGRAAELRAATLKAVADLRNFGPNPSEVANWKEATKRRREVELRENGAWASLLSAADVERQDLAVQLDLARSLRSLTPERLRQAAARYLDPGRYVRVTLLPGESATVEH